MKELRILFVVLVMLFASLSLSSNPATAQGPPPKGYTIGGTVDASVIKNGTTQIWAIAAGAIWTNAPTTESVYLHVSLVINGVTYYSNLPTGIYVSRNPLSPTDISYSMPVTLPPGTYTVSWTGIIISSTGIINPTVWNHNVTITL